MEKYAQRTHIAKDISVTVKEVSMATDIICVDVRYILFRMTTLFILEYLNTKISCLTFVNLKGIDLDFEMKALFQYIVSKM